MEDITKMKKTFKSLLAVIFCIVAVSSTMIMASAIGKPTAKVKSVTYNSVTLYWTKVSGAEAYQIQRSTNGKSWTDIAKNVKTTSYKDSNKLTTGKTYLYRVRSVDKGLFRTTYSSWTSSIKATPLPEKVVNLKVKSTTYNSIVLTWSKVAGASGYQVQYLSGKTWKSYKTTKSNSLTASKLTLGKSYTFRVRAYRTVSKKAVYGAVSSSVKGTTAIAAPTSVKLTGIGTTSVKLTWSACAGAKGYQVYHPISKKWLSAGTSRSYTVKSLKSGVKYSFIVRGYNGKIAGKSSAKYYFTTTPAAPTGVKIKDVTDSTVTFTWSSVKGAAGYQPSIYNQSTKKWTTLSTTTGNTAKATGLSGFTKYTVRVRAYVKNSNVKDISSTSYGAYSSSVNTQTVMGAPTVTTSATSSKTITVNWKKLNGASKYIVEKFDAYEAQWRVYDFTTKAWLLSDEVTAESVTTTTALSLADTGNASRADVYRVRGVDSKGIKGTASAGVTGYTKDISVTANKYDVTLKWPASEGIDKYQFYSKYPNTEVIHEVAVSKLAYDSDKNTYSINLNLAPDSIHSLLIIGTDTDTSLTSSTDWITFITKPLTIITSTSDSYYKASVNSQLLYLARAINNTKEYKEPITVKNVSEVSYSIDSLKIPLMLVDKKTPEDVEEYFKKYESDGEKVETRSTEKYTKTLKFNEGKATEDGKTIRLNQFVEPSSNKTQTAYLYKGLTSQTAWTSGFSSVKTTKGSDGSYTIKVTFKQEKTNANYHNGYMSSFAAADFGGAEGFEMNELKVGSSTLTAVIDSDGILKSYVANSPYSAKFMASFKASEDGENIKEGDLFSMTMGMSGKTVFNYTFTK